MTEPIIREVWSENLEEEMNIISKLIEKYPYVAMDTEFPGIVHYIGKVKESNYRNIKANVDDLKLIQCGISISDEKGNQPSECSTWQFNLKFDKSRDKSASDSIQLLINSGIEFEKLVTHGISQDAFGEALITSGLILNDEIKWVSFHGSYDFAYLLKVLRNLPLPELESDFLNELRLYFPVFYDIRHLTRNLEGLSKSLQRLSQDLDVCRYGIQHQAGSDALITLKVYQKLYDHYLTLDNIKNDENVLFGLGTYYEDESAIIFEGLNQNTYFGNATSSQPYIPSNKSQVNNFDGYFNQQNNFNFTGSQQFLKQGNSNHSFNYGNYAFQQNFAVDYPQVQGNQSSHIKLDSEKNK